MPNTVFFSWQADTPTREGRNFIERALECAVARISADTTVEEAQRELEVDRDTKGVPGSPPIVETIFGKIDGAAVFLPDLTFIGKRPDGRPTPNPNVLIAKDLEAALRLVLQSEEFKASLPKSPEPPKFVEREPLQGHGRFRAAGEPLGLVHHFGRPPDQVRLADGSVCWFRMIPTTEPGRTWSVAELEKQMHSPILSPVSRGWHRFNYVHGPDGYGIYAFLDDPNSAIALVFAFTTGEVWSIDAYWLRPRDNGQKLVPAHAEREVRQALVDYGNFLDRLGIKAPYKWTAGMEDLKGRHLYTPVPPNHIKFFQSHDGECLVDEVMESGPYSPGDSPTMTLKPFFSKLYESCGVSRQDWQDK